MTMIPLNQLTRSSGWSPVERDADGRPLVSVGDRVARVIVGSIALAAVVRAVTDRTVTITVEIIDCEAEWPHDMFTENFVVQGHSHLREVDTSSQQEDMA